MYSLIVFSSSANVFAYNSTNGRQAISNESRNFKGILEDSFSSDYYYDELVELGFTENEMYDLYLRECEKLGTPLKLPNKLCESIKKNYAYPMKISKTRNLYKNYIRSNSRSGFPSNPQVGKNYLPKIV